MTLANIARPASQRAMTGRDGSMLFLLGLLWAGSFFFVCIAVQEMQPLTLVSDERLQLFELAGMALIGLGLVVSMDGFFAEPRPRSDFSFY